MTTALILIASGILIGAGIGVIWRDVRRSRRRAFVLQRESQVAAEPEVEIVISRGGEPDIPLPKVITEKAAAGRVAANGHAESTGTEAANDGGAPPAQGSGLPLDQQWLVLKPILAVAIGKVNAVLAPVKLAVGASVDPAWSYKNAAYGAPRRVTLGEESIGWLRLEITADGRLLAALKAHKDDQAEINGNAETAASALNPIRAADALSRCLEPAARYAARAAGGTIDERLVSERSWKAVDPLVQASLKATNGALLQAGAKLVPLSAPTWEDEIKRHRMTLSVEVNGGGVGRMHIERVAGELEVAVGVGDQRLADLGRRRRIAVEGLTIHALAEVIASCAWPTIAHFREARSQAER
jgi:hypothetical protein